MLRNNHALPALGKRSLSSITSGLSGRLTCEFVNKEACYENVARLPGVSRYLLELPSCSLVRGQAISLPAARPPDRLRPSARRVGAAAGGYEHPAAQAVRHQVG